MLLDRWVSFCKGTVTVRISSARCEMILGALHRAGISLWKIERIDEQKLQVTVYQKDAVLLREVAKRYYADVTVVSEHGLHCYGKRYKKRFGLLAGLLAGLTIFVVTDCFLWNIEVVGCDGKTTESEVKRQFSELGFGIGSKRFGWDLTALENDFIRKNPDVMWVSVNLHFTTARIELKERDKVKPKVYDLTTPCDIYAARDGTITEMMLTNGTALVSEGDSVYAGQKLVAKEYVTKYNETIIVHSMASIMAKTKREISVTVPLKQQAHIPTGKNKNFYTLNFINFKIPLYFNEKISYNNYDTTVRSHVPKIGDFALPVSLERKRYIEVDIEERDIPSEQAKQEALAKLTEKEKTELVSTQILDRTVKEQAAEGVLKLTASYTCLEDIAVIIGE